MEPFFISKEGVLFFSSSDFQKTSPALEFHLTHGKPEWDTEGIRTQPNETTEFLNHVGHQQWEQGSWQVAHKVQYRLPL